MTGEQNTSIPDREKSPENPRRQKIVFWVFFILLPLVLLFPSLKKDWALLDDPDMITYSLDGVKKVFTRLDFSALYSPVNRVTKRYHPGIYFYLGVKTGILGLNPFINHIAHFLLLYIHLIFLHKILFSITRKYRFSVLGIILYLFYAQGEWSSAYYNWYSLMTYEPFLLVCFLGSLSLFYAAQVSKETHPKRSNILLWISILILGYAFFTKEICFIFTGVTGFIYLASRDKRLNALELKPKVCLRYFLGALFFALLFLGVYIYLKSGKSLPGQSEVKYNMNPGIMVREIPFLWMLLFQNYSMLLLILPFSYMMRLYFIFKEQKDWDKREFIQAVFLVFGVLWWVMFLPWKPKLERLLLITTWCFALFGALEIHGIREFLKEKAKERIRQTPKHVCLIFWVHILSWLLLFIFGKLFMPLKIYLLSLKMIICIFGIFFLYQLIKEILMKGQINKLFASFLQFLCVLSIILFTFFGAIGAYNFNHKYDGIEGVLVKMVRKVSRDAPPNARIYFHLPEGHMYIGEMNFRLPLFEKRPDLKAFALKGEGGNEYQGGDMIIHHPSLSPHPEFPFFNFEGKISDPEIVKIEHPFIRGASYGGLKKWLFANFAFPRDTKVKFLEKKIHKNQWEIFLVLSETLRITEKPDEPLSLSH
jgi:hypothetical protein